MTLQFIGRFARSTPRGDGNTQDGEEEMGRILAVPEELEGSIEQLYAEDSAWAELVPNLQQKTIARDRAIRQDLGRFEVTTELPEELRGASLWGLKPLAHVKIYEVHPGIEVSIEREIDLPRPYEAVYRAFNDELSTSLFISRERRRPRWATKDVGLFDAIEYDLFVVHWNTEAGLLFISASRRGSIALYEEIARQYASGHSVLPLYKINRVLRGYAGSSVFNLGMRNRQASLVNESYRILAGSEVERAVKRSDGRFFHRGHVMIGLEGAGDEGMITLGYSSSSKVWLSKYLRIPVLIEWCRQIAAQIADDSEVIVNEYLKALGVGEELSELPDNIMAARWDEEVFARPMWLQYVANTGKGVDEPRECELLEATWTVLEENASPRSVALVLEAPSARWNLDFSLDAPRLFTSSDEDMLPQITTSQEDMALLDYLNASPLHLFTADFSRVCGHAIFLAPEVGEESEERWEMFDVRSFRPRDWMAEGVLLDREFGWTGEAYTESGFDLQSIHGNLKTLLKNESFPHILYDHGTGEIADFLTLEEKSRGEPNRWWSGTEKRDSVHVYLFHVKGANKSKGALEAKPGNRVSDVYEVCGQVVKSLIWLAQRQSLAERLVSRCKGSSFFVRGDLDAFVQLLKQHRRPVIFHIGLVQPGITAEGAEPKIREVLAATDDYIRRAVGTPAFVFCSP